MSGYVDLDVLAIQGYDIDRRAIELERALEGAFFNVEGRGLQRKVREARSRANLDWSRYLYLDRRSA